ncbi:MAG TPA: methylated-DNA--[protein]-cysteine S-methyltransferase [Luteibaculaceae bacterium]|nr:methylated-DNA--[protein]-cysteine S-methyltransferase [Luteibaculaceae bacterium]
MEKKQYMLVFIPPAHVVKQVEAVREEFAQRYSAKAALKNPVHITLQPPFWMDESKEEAFLDGLDAWTRREPFVWEHDGFGSFTQPQVVYIQTSLPDDVAQWQSELAAWIRENWVESEKYSGDNLAYTPHLTIGRKDIPPKRFDEAVNSYRSLSFYATYEVRAFFVWKHNGKTWQEHGRFAFHNQNKFDPIATQVIDSPLGYIMLSASDKAITALDFVTDPGQKQEANLITQRAADELKRYFQGELKSFTVPVKWNGTLFQQQIWRCVAEVPYGQTTSYMNIGKKIGNPKAIRAIGAANGKNPIPIMVPCHRVIGSDGSLVGYSGGLARKEWLLAHEARFGGQQSLF